MFASINLNGPWEMGYCYERYLSSNIPVVEYTNIKNAVPGYWEDMEDEFKNAHFFPELKINPLYEDLSYPMTKSPPDMRLPNYIGNFFYKKSFECECSEGCCALHFSGVQNAVSVWVNGTYIGRHEGYSVEFDVEIPEKIIKTGTNEIILSVSNYQLEGYAGEPVSGLTNRAVNECTGGITGDVELRFYNSPLRDLYLSVSEDCSELNVNIISKENISCNWEIIDGNIVVKSGNGNDKFIVNVEDLERWSPENPKLYTFKVMYNNSILSRSFGIRRLLVDGVHLKLNGYPYFLRGICEHCYYPETVHPTHDKAFYINVITKLKELGFNFVRFHTHIPEEEYMQAADELGILFEVESPNNTSFKQWEEIVKVCRRHTSVVMYCCGNEMSIDIPFAEHLRKCADYVHNNTDSLFSPMSALRELEYITVPEEYEKLVLDKANCEPFIHDKERFKIVGEYTDLYNSYSLGMFSYNSNMADPVKNDLWSTVYNKPRLSHEICIDGTFTDLSLKDRYKNSRIGKTAMFSSLEEHLKSKGVLENAPLYFKNSVEWQKRIRKYCFESLRLSENMAGYDFLGPIDTHWHTFGYDVGMMNEFYELKPGETVENVLRYNSESVLLTDLRKNVNFESGSELKFGVFVSCYNKQNVKNATINIKLICDEVVLEERTEIISLIENGKVSKILDFEANLPVVNDVKELILEIKLEANEFYAENQWELYLFPETKNIGCGENTIVSNGMTKEDLKNALSSGKNIVLFGSEPFNTQTTDFKISLAGRVDGHIASVIHNHPITNKIPHKGFCGWQFASLLEGGKTVCFESDDVPFDPIIEMISTHKCFIKQSNMFELNAFSGKLFVCSFNLDENNPCAKWLKNEILSYVKSDLFNPKQTLNETDFESFINAEATQLAKNTNFAVNANDITSKRKKK